jgi:hypothetical protein
MTVSPFCYRLSSMVSPACGTEAGSEHERRHCASPLHPPLYGTGGGRTTSTGDASPSMSLPPTAVRMVPSPAGSNWLESPHGPLEPLTIHRECTKVPKVDHAMALSLDIVHNGKAT